MNVYIDITNTYITRLNTGIQRVTKELVWRCYSFNKTQNNFIFIPVVYHSKLRCWKKININEFKNIY